MYNRDAPYYADGRNKDDQKTLVDTYTPETTLRDNNSFAEWLYGEYDEEKLQQFNFWYQVPVVHQYFDYLLDLRADREYMRRYQLDPSDVHDPRKLKSTNSGSRFISSGLNFVSDIAKRLYS